MRKIYFLLVSCLLTMIVTAQDASVDDLFDNIAKMGKEYKALKLEKNAKKILDISTRVELLNAEIKKTEVIGIDSILYNIHQFSTYLKFYSDFLNNNIGIPDTLQPAQIFRKIDSTAKFLTSFDTLGYDVELIPEQFFPDETVLVNANYSSEDNMKQGNKSFAGVSETSNEKIVALSTIAGLKCCKFRVKVRIRVVTKSPKKTYDDLVHTLEDAVNTVGRMIPEDVKKLGVKVFSAALDIEGKYIHFLNDLNQRVFSVSFETFDFLRTLQEKADKELLNATNNLMNTVGLEMPPAMESAFLKLSQARSNVLRETMTGFSKAMELNYKLNDMSADALLLFSKYLLLAGTDFPPMLKKPKLSIEPADAYFKLNQLVLQKAMNKLFANTIDLDTARYKGFKMLLSGSEHKLTFDEKTGSLQLELGDFNVKGMYLLGGMADLVAPSATINIKKAKIQLVPEISDEKNTINLRPRLHYLDIKGSMPLFDRLIAWAIEKNFLENKIIPLDLDSALNDEFNLAGSLPSKLKLSFGVLKDFSIKDQYLLIGLNSPGNSVGHIAKSDSATTGFNLEVSDFLIKEIMQNSMKQDGIKFSLKQDREPEEAFDATYNHLHFKKLNELRFEENKMFIDLKTQVHLRRFLGKKPKLNFEVTHAAFFVKPELAKNKKGEPVIRLMMTPAKDQIEFSNVSKKLTRKAFKLFKKLNEPVKLTEIKIESLQAMKFDNPFKPKDNLLDPFQTFSINMMPGKMIINLQ